MQARRVVSALEHEVVPVFANAGDAGGVGGVGGAWFTESDAIALLRINEARKGFCQRTASGIRLAQHCGVLSLPSCILEILPKIGFDERRDQNEVSIARRALLAMLQATRRLPLTAVGAVGQQLTSASLLDAFVRAFLSTALAQARRGLLSRYVADSDDLPAVRGRFDVQVHFRRNFARPHLVRCQFDEFTVDNPLNRAIRATLEACKPWIVDSHTEQMWFETHTRFANVATAPMRAADVDDLFPLDRTARRYEEVLGWCVRLLSLQSPSLQAGVEAAPGLLFDMNRLFEAHVASIVEESAAEEYLVRRQNPVLYLASRGDVPVFALKPDVTLRLDAKNEGDSQVHRIIDAKWKRLKPGRSDYGIGSDDLYQLLAYALRYECDDLTLAYPMTPTPIRESLEPFELQITDRRIKVSIWLVPLWS